MTKSFKSIDKGNINKSDLHYLINHIIKNINLPDFIESETGEELTWVRHDHSAKCCCPLHKEDIPSFNINFKDEEIWVYHCFGCGAKGHIIHFCRDFHGLRNQLEAINYICQKYNIQNTSDLILEGIKQVNVKIDEQRKLENENILASNQCRMLLRKDLNLHKKWVLDAYSRLNQALEKNKISDITKIYYEASKRGSMK